MKVPDTLITNSKQELLRFKSKNGEIISKAIVDGAKFQYGKVIYQMYTEEIDGVLISELPETFPHSLFQSKLDKELEIRSFYLDGQFYSMAIFSQQNRKTAVDFRKYDSDIPNRTIPFKLPKNIETKLQQFMKIFNLNTGSIDLILDKKGNFIFLEVNPVGQFGMVSMPCNYELEKKVAQLLINKDINS